MSAETTFHFEAVTPAQWEDFERLFGPRGAVGGCWCMYMRVKGSEFEAQKGEGNRQAMKALVDSGHVPGLLAYAGGQPVGWCSVAPREHFGRVGRSCILKPVDDQPVWSVVCFYIHKDYRRKGLSTALLKAAVDYAAGQGARIVEGYPVEPKKDSMPEVFAWNGFSQAFLDAGFVEVARRSETRPIMRYYVVKRDS